MKKFIKKTMPSLFNEILFQELEKYKNKKILVAFSGGKDSLSLLDFINRYRNILNIFFGACHINHGLRETAQRDEIFCQEYCRENNINFYVYNISKELENDKIYGIEASARKYRYKYLTYTLEKYNYDYIFTAHTFSDDIESFFVDLYTGASLFTLGGIMYENNQIIRPMLNITTDMVNDYIKENNLSPVFDETNNNVKYVRNRVRHKLIPILYDCGSEFEKSVIKLKKESIKLNDYLYKKVAHVIIKKDDFVILNRDAFLDLDFIEKEYLLGKMFSLFFRVSKNILYESISFLNSNNSKRLNLPAGYILEQSYKSIKIFHKDMVSSFYYNKERGLSCFDNSDFKIEFLGDFKNKNLVIRNRLKGDTFLGKKLKDLFINKKIELFERDRAVLIEENGKIIWAEYLSQNNNIKFERFSSFQATNKG